MYLREVQSEKRYRVCFVSLDRAFAGCRIVLLNGFAEQCVVTRWENGLVCVDKRW